MVMDGVRGPEYGEVIAARQYGGTWRSYVTMEPLSPDGVRTAYAARWDDKWHVIIDGVEGEPRDGVTAPVFSPDGRKVAYSERFADKCRIVVDGVPGDFYDSVGFPVLGSDSLAVAYRAEKDGKSYVVIGSRKEGPYDETGHPERVRGTHCAYWARRGEERLGVIDGVEVPVLWYDDLPMLWMSVPSPDFSRRLDIVTRDGKRYARIDGREEGPYEGAQVGGFTSSGEHYYYLTFRERGNLGAIVVDGKAVEYRAGRDGVHFQYAMESADGSRVGFILKGTHAWAVIADGREAGRVTFERSLAERYLEGDDGRILGARFLAVRRDEVVLIEATLEAFPDWRE